MRKIIFLSTFFLFSCYSFQGALPSYVKKIYIENTGNKVRTERNFSLEFTEKLNNAFLEDNTLLPSNKKNSHVILTTTISSISQSASSYKVQSGAPQTESYKIVVKIEYKCVYIKNKKNLASGFSSQQIDINSGISESERERKILELMDLAAEEIVDKVIGAW
jgi:hypothetical protein